MILRRSATNYLCLRVRDVPPLVLPILTRALYAAGTVGPGLRFAAWKNGLSSACADGTSAAWLIRTANQSSVGHHADPYACCRNGAADAWTACEAVLPLSRVTRL